MPGSWGDCLIRVKHGTLPEGGCYASTRSYAASVGREYV